MSLNSFDVRRMMTTAMEMIEPATFYQTMFFSARESQDSDTIDLDKESLGLQVASFVEPDATEAPTEKEPFDFHTFKIPYLKPVKAIEPKEIRKRLAGENIYAPVSPQERMDRLVAKVLADNEARIQRRIELMCSGVANAGEIPILDSNGNTLRATITFPRDAATFITPSTAWDAGSPDIIGDIENGMDAAQQKSGYVPDVFWCSKDVWDVIRQDDGIKEFLDAKVTGEFVQLTSRARQLGVRYGGMLLGTPIYVLTGEYRDRDGNPISICPDNTFGMGSTVANHMVVYGPVDDFTDAGDLVGGVGERWVSSWINRNPAVRQIQTHSAPLAFTKNWNSFITITPLGESS